ncbi:FAD-dependent oxidoreductase, partial [Planktomarina temperata]|nr:FAD-dependent oxidoreductase [Planktomarina temperata]
MQHVAIIGAGIGGLAAAMRLAHGGVKVTVLERQATPGGKMRSLPSAAGMIDAGPTVLTMKPVIEALFREVGCQLADYATLIQEDILARHFWRDGTRLDLMRDRQASLENVRHSFGAAAAAEFHRFSRDAQYLFEQLNDPMMQSAAPALRKMIPVMLRSPATVMRMDPLRSLAQSLARRFSEPRLAQLFARYATYIGGLPQASPALLALIWHVESLGVWHVKGGMKQLAYGMEACAKTLGAEFHYDSCVTKFEHGGSSQYHLECDGRFLSCDAVLFNGDPNALARGLLGPEASAATAPQATMPRSLSAHVMSFAAQVQGLPLAAHNVLFAADPDQEYRPLAQGAPQHDPTLYICAQDRFGSTTPGGQERFEIILNHPPSAATAVPSEKVREQCQTILLDHLTRHGLSFTPRPPPSTLTMTEDFAQMFPGSDGSL